MIPILRMLHARRADGSGLETERPPGVTTEERGDRIETVSRAASSDNRAVTTVRRSATVDESEPLMATDADASPIVERLELSLAAGAIRSERKTPGEPFARIELALPAERMLEDYHTALGLASGRTSGPDERTSKRIQHLISPLQKALAQVVPEAASVRMAAECAGAAAKLGVIELTLADYQLERYPWELIAESARSPDYLPITVWRSVLSPMDPPVRKRWTSNLMLAGGPTGSDELTTIRAELSDQRHIQVFDCGGILPTFRTVLAEHCPAAFHLAACGDTLDNLLISPDSLAVDLGDSGAWVAVVNCRDSAAAPAASRPAAYEIARRSGAATIGLAGLTRPDISALFAATFYGCLARGFSALRGYHEAVRSVRNHDAYSAMWSLPVMYARTPNVIPFPIDDAARVRQGLAQVQFHVSQLDQELEELEGWDFRGAGEWADHAATPIVRTDCISEYLAEVSDPASRAFSPERKEEIDDARNEFETVLSDTADSLILLSDYTAGSPEHQRTLSRLRLHRMRHQRMLRKLEGLVREAR
jgi:hypothetical protein